MARVALGTLFGAAFPEAAETGRIIVIWGIFGKFSIQEVDIMV